MICDQETIVVGINTNDTHGRASLPRPCRESDRQHCQHETNRPEEKRERVDVCVGACAEDSAGKVELKPKRRAARVEERTRTRTWMGRCMEFEEELSERAQERRDRTVGSRESGVGGEAVTVTVRITGTRI